MKIGGAFDVFMKIVDFAQKSEKIIGYCIEIVGILCYSIFVAYYAQYTQIERNCDKNG